MNKKDRVIVGVCGFGYSGSGAVLDWMKGYQDINVIDSFEFSFLYTPDGLLDLKYHLIDNCAKYMSSDIALVRFLNYMKKKSSEVGKKGKLLFGITKEYIKSLVQVEWRGYWMFDYYSGSFFKRNIGFRLFHSRLFKIMPSLPQKHPKLPPLRKMYVSVRPDSFYEKTNNYLNGVIDLLQEKESSMAVLNQPFPANQPDLCLHLINNSKAVIVDRDPRDLYVLFKKIIPNKSCFVPVDNVDNFIAYFEAIRSLYPKNSENVLIIQFEDLIYDFDKTIKMLESFLDLDKEKFDYSKTKFDPIVSLENTQLFNKYPELKSDINLIEQKLSKWLYCFDSKQIKPSANKTLSEIVKIADK